MGVLFANIGNSDLLIKRVKNEEKAKREMEWAENLLKFDTQHINDNTEMPLLEPVLKKINENYKIYLFASYQTKDVDEYLRGKDTLNTAKVIKKLLNYRGYEHVEVIPINNESYLSDVPEQEKKYLNSPSHYDYMNKFYVRKLPEILSSISHDILPICFSLTGGTPACSMGMFYAALTLGYSYQDMKFFYTNEEHKNKANYEADELNVGKIVAQEDALKVADKLLDGYDYDGLVLTLELLGLKDQALKHVLEAMSHRYNFAFENALAAVDKAVKTAERVELFNLAQEINNDLNSLLKGKDIYENRSSKWLKEKDMQNVLIELYWSVVMRQEKERWLDFSLRMFTLLEVVLKVKLISLIGTSTVRKNKQKEKGERTDIMKSIVKVLNEDHYKKIPDKKTVKQIKNNKKENRHILKAVINVFNKESNEDNFNTWFEWTNAIAEIRNNTAHNLGGISWEKIQAEMKKENPSSEKLTEEDLLKLTRDIYRDLLDIEIPDRNKYHIINNKIKQYIRIAIAS